MKYCLAILLLALAFSCQLRAQDNSPLTVAILDFQTSGGKLDKKGPQAAAILSGYLSNSSSLILVERQDLEKILGEQELGLSGSILPDTVAKIGALTGAKVLITGRLLEVGNEFYLVAKLMSTETGRVYGEYVTLDDLGALDKAVGALASKIQFVIDHQGPKLVAEIEHPGERISRLRKIVAGKKLPVVSINIAEHHLTRALIDPAVETEFKLVLQEIGFVVIDPASSTTRADVRITGEAFSEFGSRRGNLVCSLARVEVKALRQDSGLLAVDRQREVALDLSEHVAAKEALQAAAIRILDRLVPRLAEGH
jgi:hypothetical protein